MATRTELSTQKIFGFTLPVGANGELIKQSIVAVLTAMFLLTVFVFFVYPRLAQLQAAQKRVADIQTQINNLTKSLGALDAFRGDVSAAAKEGVFLAIPTRFDPGYILLSLRQLATENQVDLVSYTMSGGEVKAEETEKGTLIPHEVNVEISGPPINLINFVDGLDGYLPIASVSELSISEVGKIFVSGSTESRLNLTLAYYNKPLAPVPTGTLLRAFLTPDELATINRLATYKRLTRTTVGVPMMVGKENLFGL